MHRTATLAPFLSLSLATAMADPAAAQFTSGNLVAVRVGDGSASLTSAATPVFLVEYTTTGTLAQTVPMPTVTSGANRRFTNSGTATSEGFLNLSANGQYLVSAGYDAAPGTAAVVSTASATNPRVVARIDLNAVIDTSTALADAYSANNIRSATTDDGSRFWVGGTASSTGGVRYATRGASTSTQISTSVTNTRVVGIAGGQLFVTSSSGAFQGVCVVGSGLPTTSGQVITVLPGFPTTAGPSAYDYFFADASTLYVADDRASAAGGIQKWTATGGTWSLQYTLNPAPNVGCRGLTGSVSGGVATLYATTAAAGANQIVKVTDAGAGSPFTTVATSSTNTVFRGLRYLPERGSFTRLPHGCGPTTIAVSGHPRTGGTIRATLGGVTGQPFLGVGFSLANLPFCGCTIGHDWLIVVPGATLVLPVPNFRPAIGLRAGIQGIDALGAGGCPAPQLTLTDTIVATIG